MKCKSCQKEISEDFKLCPYCGEPVSSDSAAAQKTNQKPPAKNLSPDAIIAAKVKEELENKFNQQNNKNDQQDDDLVMQEEEDEFDQEEEAKYRRRKKKSFNKRGILVTITMIIIVSAGIIGYFLFDSSPLNQNVKEIEAGIVVDPLELVSLGSKDTDKYTFEVAENTIDINVPGEYTVTYTLTNASNNKTKDVTFKFKVVDTTPPEIKADDPVKTTIGKEFNILSVITVTDTVDGVIDPKNVSVQGTVDINNAATYPLTLSVSDKAGNKATKTINILVQDMGDPNAFFDNITGSWVNYTTKVVCKFSLTNGIFSLNIGRYQSEGYGEGNLTFLDVNGDNTIANFNWDYRSYTNENPPQYSAIEKKTVVVDTGTPKDNKISIDLGNGNGLQEYSYLGD